MKVRDLVKALKQMPQNADVGVSMHDNSEFEIAGWVRRVCHEKKADFNRELDESADAKMINSQPDEWVNLCC